MDELAGLADAAGAEVVLRLSQERAKPDAATYLGRGKLETLAAACSEARVDVVIFDNELSPAQLRQIEAIVKRKVVDRTELILDIFARRARTREGKWQVELAQLEYMLPRLAGSSSALSRRGPSGHCTTIAPRSGMLSGTTRCSGSGPLQADASAIAATGMERVTRRTRVERFMALSS